MRIKAKAAALAAAAIAMGIPSAALAATASEESFGTLPDGRQVTAVTLSNDQGVSATVINWGAALQSLIMPDRDGEKADVQLGYPTLEGYLTKPEYFGATVGRFANRIAEGRFTIDGKTYQTPVNNGPNSLHGGTVGFDKVLWEIVSVEEGPTAKVTLRYVSPDGDQGYPGELTVFAIYSLDEENALTIEYRATTDEPTIVNISNHAYWNLLGEGSGSAMGHILTIPADYYTPVDETLIPTGEFRPVEGTVFDFREPHAVGERVRAASDQQIVYGRGYDHNFVIARTVSDEPRLMARVEEPVSGRGFELWSNQPGLQFYSGNFFDGTIAGKSKGIYRQGDAIVLEPQLFPDTPNQPAFGSGLLEPGETYRNVMIYRLLSGQAKAAR